MAGQFDLAMSPDIEVVYRSALDGSDAADATVASMASIGEERFFLPNGLHQATSGVMSI